MVITTSPAHFLLCVFVPVHKVRRLPSFFPLLSEVWYLSLSQVLGLSYPRRGLRWDRHQVRVKELDKLLILQPHFATSKPSVLLKDGRQMPTLDLAKTTHYCTYTRMIDRTKKVKNAPLKTISSLKKTTV